MSIAKLTAACAAVAWLLHSTPAWASDPAARVLSPEEVAALYDIVVAPGEALSRVLEEHSIAAEDVSGALEFTVQDPDGLTHTITALTAQPGGGQSNLFLFSPVPDAVREELLLAGVDVPLGGIHLRTTKEANGQTWARIGFLGSHGEAIASFGSPRGPTFVTAAGSLGECFDCLVHSLFSTTCEAVAVALLCSTPAAPALGCQGALAQRVLEFIIGQIVGQACGGNFACAIACNVPTITVVPGSNSYLQPGSVPVTVRSTFSQAGTWFARRRQGSGQLLDGIDYRLTGAEGSYTWQATDGSWTLIGGNIPNPLSFTIPWAGFSRNVTVATNRPPTVTITSPANGAIVSGTLGIQASATDDVAVSQVEFFVNGVRICTDTSSPYSCSWDTRTAANGSHWVHARAYDGAGASGSSPTVGITVNNATSTQLVRNGGFEGSSSPWGGTGNAYWTGTSAYPHTGTGYVFLGHYNNAVGTLYQTITIPSTASSASLTFWLNVTSQETSTSTAYDRLYVEVANSSGSLLATVATYSNLSKASIGVYSQKGAFNLLSFRGQTIQLRFRVVNDSSNVTTFRIDDVSIR